jgi:uncharacterized protein (DUF2267 family)
MDYNRFIRLVKNRARLATTEDAVTATRATLETLAERIGAEEAYDVAAQLPREVAHYLEESPPSTRENFSFDEFCQRVAEREECELKDAVFHSCCVIETLEEAVTSDELSQLIGMLPEEFVPLFASGHEGKMLRLH